MKQVPGVDADPRRAKRYFRFCAAAGAPECQYRLAALMLHLEPRSQQDQAEAVAWLELAQDHNFPQANALASSEAAKLTPDQLKSVADLKLQLQHKH